jgi:replication factor A1
MSKTIKFKDIVIGKEDYKVFGRLIRLWDARYVSSNSTNTLLSIDGILLDEDVSFSYILSH